MTHDDDDHDKLAPSEVRARLMASPPRRVIATAMIAALGLLILYLAVTVPPASLGWRLFLIACGALCLWLAVRLWNATAIALELTGTELRETGGRVLARLEDIDSISRGAFALKPSNGFTLVLMRPAPAVWAPGLWWRLGRHIGVGGVTGRFDSRRMADTIADAVAARRNR